MPASRPRSLHGAFAFAIATCVGIGDALAHASERGHVLLLPTHLYITGGALAVAASFAVLWLGSALGRTTLPILRLPLPAAPAWLGIAASLASAVLLATLLLAAYLGAPDPIANPLPGFIWSFWWIGFPLLTGVIGNLWPVLNPWSGLARLLRHSDNTPLLRYPERLGQWPAVALLLAFAWLELVDPKAQDPQHLAEATLAYSVLTIGGMALFGIETWSRQAECFSIFFRMIGALSAVQWPQPAGERVARVGPPGFALKDLDLTPPGAVAFVLLALSTVSFDGFMRTFTWLGALGVNPLEFPGRSAMVEANSAALVGFFLLFLAIYRLAIRMGEPPGTASHVPYTTFAAAIVPIAFGYHLAHYLPSFPLDGLKALKALSDPFAIGADFLGLSGIEPPATLTAGHRAATFVYRLQTAIIVAAHIMAVMASHAIATRLSASRHEAFRRELPLTLLMIAYTVLGLWLLSTPVIG